MARGRGVPFWVAAGLGWLGACGDDPAPFAPSTEPPSISEPVDSPLAAACLLALEPDGECRRDADCEPPRRCVLRTGRAGEDYEPAPLHCADPQGLGTATTRCAAHDDCIHGMCAVGGTCVAPCVEHADCRGAQRCGRAWIRTDRYAMQPLDACVAAARLPVDVGVERETVAGALTGGERASAIPLPGAVAAETTVSIVDLPCGIETAAQRLRTADDTLLFDFARSVPDDESPANPLYAFGHPLVVMLPAGPRSPLAEGYVLDVFADAPGDVERTTLRRGARGGTLDLDVFYVGVRGLSPEGDRGPPELASALEEVELMLGAAGLRLGEVRQHEVVGSLMRRYQIIESDDTPVELAELFQLSAAVPGPSVPLFLVRSAGGALGVSGGIPGPPGLMGTPASGVAVASDIAGTSLGRVIGHELGHFLGLFHTSEANGSSLEALPDTPRCGPGRDADGDGWLLPFECGGAGADHLMFWAASGSTVSDAQLDVIGRTLVARP